MYFDKDSQIEHLKNEFEIYKRLSIDDLKKLVLV